MKQTQSEEGEKLNQATYCPRPSVWVFLSLLFCVYTTAWFVVGSLANLENAGVVAVGVICDIVIVVPLAFYLLLVRRKGHSFIRVAPVVVVSLIIASVMIPPEHQKALHVLEAIVVPAEIGIIGWVIWRAVRAMRAARALNELDPVEQFRTAAFGILKNHRAAGVFATEISIIYYGLGSWRADPHSSSGATGFTYHRRSGLAGVVLGFVMVLVVEGIAVHLLLSMWSALAAWIFSLSSIYGALWLISEYRASVLRPVLVREGQVLIRSGVRYTAVVSRSDIVAVTSEKPELGNEALSLKLFGTPSCWVHFSKLTVVQGPYGTTKKVRAIGFDPDDPHGFEQAFVSGPGGCERCR